MVESEVTRYGRTSCDRNPNDKHSLKVRRKRAILNQDYLKALIRQRPLES